MPKKAEKEQTDSGDREAWCDSDSWGIVQGEWQKFKYKRFEVGIAAGQWELRNRK